MKTRKIITALGSIVMAVTLGVSSLAACKSKGCKPGEHAYRWTVTKEATCSAEGSRQGVCGICGDVENEKIEINAEAHAYGDWAITAPTESAAGTAEKTCTLNASHKVTVDLPVVTAAGTGYKSSEIVTPATAAAEGKQHLVMDTAAGELAFDVTLPRREVKNIGDAVTLASSLGSLIRSATGYFQQSKNGVKLKFNTTFGENHTHIVEENEATGNDNDRRSEYWFSYDKEGKPFGVFYEKFTDYVSDGPLDPDAPAGDQPTGTLRPVEGSTDPQVYEDPTDRNLLGFGYESGGGFPRTYGAEETLARYYAKATESSDVGTSVKFTSKFEKKTDGSVVAGFSYSFYENPAFCRYFIDFELYPNGVIKTMTVQTNIIRAYMLETDEKGEKVFYSDGDAVFAEMYETDAQGNPLYEYDSEGNPVYETDASGNPVYKTDANGEFVLDRNGNKIRKNKGPALGTYYSDEHSEVSVRTLVYENQVQKTPSDVVEENKYDSDVLYINSFDVKYNGNVIGDDGVELPTNQSVTLNIDNVKPTTATLDYDPLKIYVRSESRDTELTANFNDTAFKIIGFFIKENKTITLNSQKSGEVTLVLKTYGGKCEKILKVEFEKGAPSTIMCEAYSYSVAGGTGSFNWTEYTDTTPVTVYEGQKLLIRAKASDAEAAFADTSFTAECSNTTDISFTETTFEGLPAAELTATKDGEYTVYLRYKKPSSATGGKGERWNSFKVVVLDPPAKQEILKGEYKGALKYIKSGEQTVAADVKVTFTYGNNWRRGSIDMVIGDGNTCKYDYEYDEATNKINATYKQGVSGETYDFTFAINDAYCLELTHSTGFGDIKETIVLTRPEAE